MADIIASVPRICTCPLCGCVNVRGADWNVFYLLKAFIKFKMEDTCSMDRFSKKEISSFFSFSVFFVFSKYSEKKFSESKKSAGVILKYSHIAKNP